MRQEESDQDEEVEEFESPVHFGSRALRSLASAAPKIFPDESEVRLTDQEQGELFNAHGSIPSSRYVHCTHISLPQYVQYSTVKYFLDTSHLFTSTMSNLTLTHIIGDKISSKLEDETLPKTKEGKAN